MALTEWLPEDLPGWAIHIESRAGCSTNVHVKHNRALNIAFDMGSASPNMSGVSDVFISHSHLDHISGSFLHARIAGFSKKVVNYHVPEECIEDFVKAKEAFEGMDSEERKELKMNIIPVKPGHAWNISRSYRVEAFETFHRVSSFGYVVYERVKKLKPEFLHLTGEEKGLLGRQAVELYDSVWSPQVAYTGDTIIDSVLMNPVFTSAKILVMEMTFLGGRGGKDTVDNAREKGHIHLDEIVAYSSFFEEAPVQRIVGCHFSLRYGKGDVIRIINSKCSRPLLQKMCAALNAFGGADHYFGMKKRPSSNSLSECPHHRSKFRAQHGICFAFQRGRCERGDQCWFDHITPTERHGRSGQSTPTRSNGKRQGRKSDKVCFQFAKGTCTRGATCMFRHTPARRSRSVDSNAHVELEREDTCASMETS